MASKAKESIMDVMTPKRVEELRKAYEETPRKVSWDGWFQQFRMWASRTEAAPKTTKSGNATMDAMVCEAAGSMSFIAALYNAVRVGLPLGELATIMVRGGTAFYFVTLDGRIRLCHQAGIIVTTGAVSECDFEPPGMFVINKADGTVDHLPNMLARMRLAQENKHSPVVCGWAKGEWTGPNGERVSIVDYADFERMGMAKQHGRAELWDLHPAAMSQGVALKVLWRYLPRSAEMDALAVIEKEGHDEPRGTPATSASPLDRAVNYDAPLPDGMDEATDGGE